ncbi:MAG: S-layer homology domain-containing protein [Syntrophomonadaceae bacterium]|jgi:hypothetical protein
MQLIEIKQHASNKLGALFIILAMLVMSVSFAAPVEAGPEHIIQVSNGSGTPESTVSITVSMSEIKGLAGVQYVVNFDKEQLTLTNRTWNPASYFNASSSTIKNDLGYISIASANGDGDACSENTAMDLVTLNFTVKPGAYNGTYPITITNTWEALKGSDGTEDVALGTPVDGSITITGGIDPPPGPAFSPGKAKIDTDNSRVYFEFDQAVYGDTGATTAIDKDDFTFTYNANGSPLGVTFGTLNNASDIAPAAGDKGFFLFLTLTGNGGLATGQETITITPKDGASIYNATGAPMLASATTGPLYLNDTTPPTFTAEQGAEQDPGSKEVLINITPSENVNWWIVFVTDGDTAPSIAQIKAGHNSENNPALSYSQSGTPATPAGYGFYTTLPADATNYDAYMVVADEAGNDCSSPSLINVTTPRALSTDATVTSAAYTVSIGGTGSETITGVPFGTSKANFLAALTAGDANQSWNDNGIADPVVDGDTLVVTAEDGTTQVTYTIDVDPQIMVTSITVTGTGGETTMLDNAHGGSLQMLADVLPNDAYNKAVTWSVTNGTGSAYIDPATGLLNQGIVGTVTVKATANDGSGVSDTLVITIRGVRMSTGGVSMIVDDEYQLTAEAVPSGDPIASWTSSNTAVATVDGTGLVTAVAVGTAIITASTADGREGRCNITVSPKPLATLANLTISSGTLTPTFNKNTYNYTATVTNSTSSIEITYTPYAGTTVTGDGIKQLIVGKNTFNIVVEGADYTTATYKIVITRKSASSDPGGGGPGGGSTFDGTLIKYKEGRTVSDSSLGAKVQIPAYAMDQDFKVKIEKASSSGLNVPDDKRIVGKVIEFTKDLAGNFEKDITITLNFDEDDIDFSKYSLSLYYYNTSGRKWVELENVKVDKGIGRVTGETDRFGKFALLTTAKEEPVKPPVKPPVTPPAKPPVTPPVTPPADIAGHWAAGSITKLVNSKAITGYPDNTFRPDNNISRAEFATILVKVFKLSAKDGKVFGDTEKHWAKDSISTAQAYGIINGYSEWSFGPDDNITREQMAVMIVKAAGLKPAESTKNFSDKAQISSWAKAAVDTAVANGIMSGYPDNTFKPLATATRAEAATIFANIMK